jgi:hypothetical protein
VAQVLAYFVYLYLLSIFVYAESTRGGKPAGLPPRLFTLPIRTSLLVAWPMLYGTLAVAVMYGALYALILLPCGRIAAIDWLPALGFAATMACFQAVCWTLVRSPLLRLVVAIIGLPSVVLIGVLYSLEYDLKLTRSELMLGLGAIIGLAYLVAVAGVARDRRGEGLSWAWLRQVVLKVLTLMPAGRRPFGSPMAAQRWLELRRHGWVLPAFMGFFLAMLFWGAALPLSREDVAKFAVAMVTVPVLLAFFVGFGMGKTSFWARDLQLSSFIATRPLSCTQLANAKLQGAALSALATWSLVLVLSPLWAILSGNVDLVRALCEMWFHDQPAWKLAGAASLALAGLVALTWLQLVAGMCLSLTGRAWVVNTVVFTYALVGAALGGLGVWTGNYPDFVDTLPIVLWWLGGTLILLKLGAFGWTWTALGFGHALAEGRLGRLAVWLAAVASILAPLYLFVPQNSLRTHLVALYVVLALPLSRLMALPAAVAWNRHR